MRISFISMSISIAIILGAFNNTSKHIDNTDFRKNIKFNHLFIVVDDSTYKYLFGNLKLPKNFAKISEQTVNAGSVTWKGKYMNGTSNYLEFFRPGAMKGSKLGDFGMGFITNKFGTLHVLQDYWTKKLDSVHLENRVITDSGKTTPWFTSVSIPNVNALKISAWVIENAKEEMNYAGFSDHDLEREIEFSDYLKHMTAKVRRVPVDSVKNDQLFDKVTSLRVSLSGKELAYLKRSLLDIGFTEKNNSFTKEGFTVTYSSAESAHFLLKEVGFSLSKKTPKENYVSKKIDVVMDGDKATMKFKYD